MFVNLNISSFVVLLQKFVFRFRKRIINSDNSLVNGIVNFPSLHRYLAKYGPGGLTFLTHIHNNRCIIICVGIITDFLDRFVY